MKKLIAIDPGMHNSGLAVYKNGAFYRLEYPNLWEVMAYIHKVGEADYKDDVLFLVENSNLERATFGRRGGAGHHTSAGKNKGISQEIVNHCKRCGVSYEELRPAGYSEVYRSKAMRKGKLVSHYTDHDKQVFEADTGWKGRSNEHNRAACAMIMRYINQNEKQWKQ